LLVAMAGCTSDGDAPSVQTGATVEPGMQTYEAVGVVKAITPSRTFMNIDHEAIPGFMDAMAMMFAVKDSSVLEGVVVGDSIRFVLEVGSTIPQISRVDVLN